MLLNKQALLLMFLAPALSVMAAERQMLSRPVPAAARRVQAVGRLAADQRLNFAIALPLRQQDALTNLLAGVCNPASPCFRQFLTPEQFAAQFGPTDHDYQTLLAYARTNHFRIVHTHPNRTLLTVNASVADIEQAFRVSMRTYRHPTENRIFHAPDANLSLDLAISVLAVCGLNNFSVPHPAIHPRPLTASLATPQTGSGPSSTYWGYDFRAAYAPGVTLTGAGQSVGLFQLDGFYPNDIAIYKSLTGLPNVPVNTVLLDGYDGTPGGNNDEVSLDIEMAIAMAPGLNQVIVYEADPTYGVGNDVLNQMATDNAARQLSSSWASWSDLSTGDTPDPITDQIFQQMALQGQSFSQASGDSDAYSGQVYFPVDNPYITVVGGTTLTTTSGVWSLETAWNWNNGTGTGGGISTYYSIPVWQQGISMAGNQGSTTMRNLPDVALTADNIYIRYNNGSYETVGGTSCATPLWAGFMALVNQQVAANGMPPVGFANPALYAIGKGTNYTTAFHDTTNGNNTSTSSPGKFFAATGYDLCTGWGTPTGSNLVNALAPFIALRITPFVNTAFVGPVGGAFAPAADTLLLTNAGNVSLNWKAGTTSTWFALAASSGTLPAGGTTNLAVTLTATAATLPANTYSGAIMFTNLLDGSVQSRTFALLVGQPVIQNGGFETGDNTGWYNTYSDYMWANPTANSVKNTYNHYVPGSAFIHSGSYGMALGAYGELGYLSQTVQTIPGRPYLLSFWLQSPAYVGDPNTPNEFRVQWGGGTLFDQTNMPYFVWTNMQFVVLANAPTTLLSFGTRNDPAAFALDDVSAQMLVMPQIESFLANTNRAAFVWNASTNLHYQIQYTTNLISAQWMNLGAPLLGTNVMVSATVSSPIPTQSFFRVILQP